MERLITIVNEQDEVIDAKPRNEITREDIFRVSSLWVYNSAGEILIAQRAANKRLNPNVWQSAVAGTVEEGESYGENIIKETQEEIGISVKEEELIPFSKTLEREAWTYFVQRYLTRMDKNIEEFTIQKEEVQAIQWMARDEFLKIFKENPAYFVLPFQTMFHEVDRVVQSLLSTDAGGDR